MRKVFWILGGLMGLVLLLVLFVSYAGNKKFEAPYPDIKASADPDVIARGEYLVYGPAHCATCHVPMNKVWDVEAGLKIPLSGGWEIAIPPVTLRAPNLTPDEETGIGLRTDQELARTIRHGVAHDGSYIVPVMPYSQMSDDDLQAIISFLRSQPAVKNEVPRTKYTFLGKALLTAGILKPQLEEAPPPKFVSTEDTIAYGKYMAVAVANCMGCHTKMNMLTAEFEVPEFAGGFYFEPDVMSEGYSYMSPNLTPCPETGTITHWTEDQFVQRMKNGRVHKTSPMAWGAFSRMDTFELQAIYHYLKTLPPAKHAIAQTVYLPGEKPEE